MVWNGDQHLNTQINNDGGANYTQQRVRNQSGSINASNATVATMSSAGYNAEYIINAATGSKRLIYTKTSSKTISSQQDLRAWWYQDTIANITTLDCTPSVSATGTATLYRKKPTRSGTLPWRLVKSIPVSGDFSGGYTFSGLEGDSVKLYRVEFLGSNTSNINIELRSQVNSDSSNINNEQFLKGDTSTASAAAATRTYIVNCKLQNGDQSYSNTIIYPKTGSSRPILTECSYDENALEKTAHWYGDSITEMTSLKVFGYIISGTLNLYELK